jgi:hypothetical protein
MNQRPWGRNKDAENFRAMSGEGVATVNIDNKKT